MTENNGNRQPAGDNNWGRETGRRSRRNPITPPTETMAGGCEGNLNDLKTRKKVLHTGRKTLALALLLLLLLLWQQPLRFHPLVCFSSTCSSNGKKHSRDRPPQRRCERREHVVTGGGRSIANVTAHWGLILSSYWYGGGGSRLLLLVLRMQMPTVLAPFSFC